MGKRELEEAPRPEVPPVHPTAIYTEAQLRALLGLKPSSVSTAVRKGELRVARRAGKYLFTGQWILDWVTSGEVKRDRGADPPGGGAGDVDVRGGSPTGLPEAPPGLPQ